MAQYKVPQDVEADDKLIGPFSFRQFVYLMIAGALIAVAVGLFQIFPLLAILPLPPALFFVVLALPLKKDQPMETYLAALVSYYTKPRTRIWEPGQKTRTIEIMAPKKVEESRTRDITGEEATHRLSFLADIVDTEGYAIKGISGSGAPMREDLMAEASTAVDMFEGTRFNDLTSTIQQEETERRAEVMRQMQETIQEAETVAPVAPGVVAGDATGTSATGETIAPGTETVTTGAGTVVAPDTTVMDTNIGLSGVDEGFAAAMVATGYNNGGTGKAVATGAGSGTGNVTATGVAGSATEAKKPAKARKSQMQSEVVVMPEKHVSEEEKAKGTAKKSAEKTRSGEDKTGEEKAKTKMVKASIIELVNNNKDYSVETLAKEAKRIKGKEEGEVFISLH